MVVIKDLDNSEPPELLAIRGALDQALEADGKGLSCHTVANTIFPSVWNPEADRHELYQRYRRILPRVRKHRGNRYGLYFERLIAFGNDSNLQGGVNQLEHVIETWIGGNHRRTALLATVFDPRSDHTNQRQRGFPCLQQVAFTPRGENGLSITGFYATQYMFQRAYGNYLGLSRLGRFMAHEMGLELVQATCIATPAVRDGTKAMLSGLADQVKTALDQQPVPTIGSDGGGSG